MSPLSINKHFTIHGALTLVSHVLSGRVHCVTKNNSDRCCYMISGYNFQCDINQLSQSYKDMKCFKNCEKLLDIQNVYKEPRGGLAGLAEVRIYDVLLVFRVFCFSRSSIC